MRTNHTHAALDQLAIVESFQHVIEDIYEGDTPTRASRLAGAHAGVGRALKLAEIRAQLAIADELRQLREAYVAPFTIPGATERLICANGSCGSVTFDERYCEDHA